MKGRKYTREERRRGRDKRMKINKRITKERKEQEEGRKQENNEGGE